MFKIAKCLLKVLLFFSFFQIKVTAATEHLKAGKALSPRLKLITIQTAMALS